MRSITEALKKHEAGPFKLWPASCFLSLSISRIQFPARLAQVRKIFHREELPILFDHAHANRIHVRIENIHAMVRATS